MFAVTHPVIDLRRHPHDLSTDLSHHDDRETQLLFAEPVRVLEIGPFCKVHALLQSYTGWVRQEEIAPLHISSPPTHVVATKHAYLKHRGWPLSYGTVFPSDGKQVLLPDGSEDEVDGLRPLDAPMERLLQEAHIFVGDPYLWGGCSQGHLGKCQGVDCSGLVHLLFRSLGMILPRDAKDQALVGEHQTYIQAGDAVYLFKEGKRPHHVILALSETVFIEAPQTGQSVRLLHLGDHLCFYDHQLKIFDRDPCHWVVKRFASLPRNLSRAFV